MTEPRLSSATQALLRAARSDAPSATARAKVWSTVAGTVGGAGVAGTVSTASTSPGTLGPGGAGGASVAKMLAMGTLLGGAVTVGLATMLLRVTPLPERVPSSVCAAATPSFAAPSFAAPSFAESALHAAAPGSLPVTAGETSSRALVAFVPDATPPPSPLARGAKSALLPVTVPPLAAAPTGALAGPTAATRASHAPSSEDTMEREISLVAQAHAALVRGDAATALRAVRAARALRSHVLGPEELSLEAQALRALGRDEQAKDVDSALKKQFPESALAR
jgi:hypothetical protein